MPVRVDVPTRVRVDPAALTDRRADLEEALGAAAERALATSHKEVLKPRWSHAQVRLNDPEFTWLGTGLDDVPTSLRAEVEACLSDALWRAAGRAGVREPARARPRRLEPASEPIDEDRYDELLASYEVPSYAGGTQKAHVQNPRRKPPDETVKSYSLRRLSERQARDALAAEIRKHGLDSQYIACLYVNPAGHLQIDVYKWPEQRNVYALAFAHQTLQKDPKHRNKHVLVAGDLPANARYLIGGARGVGPDAVALLTEHFAQGLRDLAEEEKRPRSADEIQREAKAIATSALSGKDIVGLLDFRVNGRTTYMTLIKPFPAEIGGWVRVIPLFDVQEVPKGKKTTAKGAGGPGAGGRGGTRVGEGEPGGEAVPVVEPEPGPLIDVPEELTGEKGGLFPPALGGKEITHECSPYKGEPAVDELGAEGERLLHQMVEIAHMLDMPVPPCKYAGTFLLHAAATLGSRAAQIATWDEPEPADLQPAPNGAGNLGDVDFAPGPSIRIEFLRHLATVVPRIHWLKQSMESAYKARPDLISGTWHGEAISWELRHSHAMIEAMNDSIAVIFVRTCQVLFLQLLHASRREIKNRQNSEFVKYFAAVIVPQLEGLDELLRAQEILKNAQLLVMYPEIRRSSFADVRLVNTPPAIPLLVMPSRWEDSTQTFNRSLAPPAPTSPTSDFFELIRQDDGTYRVRDKHGRVWEQEKLETNISFLRGSIESEEPFVKQLVKIHEVMDRFRAAAARQRFNPNLPGVEAEVTALLDEFCEHNAKIERDARSHPMEAFRSSRISEGYTKTTIPGTHFSLQGIHRQAHEEIGEFFAGAPYYALGINELFDQVEGRRKLLAWAEFVGIVLLSIVFPPAGAAVAVAVAGGTLAYLHYREAKHKEEVYEALINPDEVLSYAEVEAALFSAKVGAVFAALPIGGALLGRIKGAIGLVARAGTEAAEEAAAVGGEVGTAVAGAAAKELSLAAQMGFAEAFAYEYAKQTVMTEAIEWALGPVLESELKQRLAQDPVGGIEGAVNAYLAQMVEQRQTEGAAEEAQP